ncbi:hypothetical protein ACOSQ4_021700 [Xanthoceras sorbifolium]
MNRIIRKRIHVRVEHVQPSRCKEELKLRIIRNDELKAEAKARGEKISTKRQPEGPKPGLMLEGATLETVTPIPYDVGNKIIRKRIHVRVEHVQPSRWKEELKLRIVRNDELKAEAKTRVEKISTKRQPEGPKPGFMVEGATLETVTPIPYDVVNDLKWGY